MSRHRWLSIALITAAVLCAGRLPCAFAVINLGVVPTPHDFEPQDGSFTVDASTPLVLSPQATEGERFAAERLRDALRELFNLPLAIQTDVESAASAKSIVIGKPDAFPEVASRMKKYGLTLSEKMRKEGYVLGVGNDGVVIGALSDAGVLYGTMTLRQMIQAREAAAPLPGVKIHDWPYLGMRGIQDEISYGQVSTMENFKDIIRFLALYKMNTMFIYIEDMFQFKKYPTIGVGRGALSKEQVDELEAFAKPYNVEIIPIFEMLGNQGALLMLDEVRPFAEYPGAHSFATDDAAFEFLTNCFNELTDAFDSHYFHPGLDESWDLGYGKTEEAVKRDGRGPVHAAHYRRLNELLKSRGKTMIMYADIILTRPEILKLIPKDIILMDWQYDPAQHYPTLDKLAKYDFPLMVMPGMNNWDHFFPAMSSAMIDIRNFTLDAIRHEAIGSFTSTWGDSGSKNLRELCYSGYAYGAQVMWSPGTTDVGDFSHRFFTLHNGPGTSPLFESIYAHLEKWPWADPIPDFFRHPFLPRKNDKPHAERELYQAGEDARVAEELVEVVRPLVKRRKGDLDYLTYCARTHQLYVRGQRLVRDLQSFDPKGRSPQEVKLNQSRFIDEIQYVSQHTAALRDAFRDLWLRTNLAANLQYGIEDYDRLIKVWNDAEKRVASGVFAYDPRPASQWIYHPAGFDEKQKRQVQHAYFRRSFEVDPAELSRAGIQLYGDTHINIYVNGTHVGEQFARRNFSAPVNPQLVKLYDIVPYLKSGRNVIAVDAHNYGTENKHLDPGGPVRCGGFHFYGEAVSKSGEMATIVSDASWKVSDQPADGWTKPEFSDESWLNAKPDPKPTIWVTVPDFTENFRGFSDVR